MKRFLVAFIFVALVTTMLFAADMDIINRDNKTSLYFKNPVPTEAGYQVGCLQAESTLSVNGVSTSIGTVPAGANKVILFSTSALNYNENEAAAVATLSTYFTVATTTRTVFEGAKSELEGLTFILKDGVATATVYMRFY